jgi:lysophospholipase L1-like esterase
MRSALKVIFIGLCDVILICATLAGTEYLTRKLVYGRLDPPSRQTELILDRWAGFRNNPNYTGKGVHLNAQGFRRDGDVQFAKSPHSIRLFLAGGSVAYGGETLYPEIDGLRTINNHETIDYFLEQKLNSAFPEQHWEVINAAVKGYLLNQNLASLRSTLRQYQPDYLILLDGVNDMFAMLRSPEDDSYVAAGLGDQFNALTKPDSMSLPFMVSTWLFNNSALYRSVRESVGQNKRIRARVERARMVPASLRPDFARLTINEQGRYQAAVNRLGDYLRDVRDIHQLAKLEAIRTVFVLQPQIAVTRKPLTQVETQVFEYWSKLEGPLFVYGFETLYPQLSDRLASGAQMDGYQFLDATHIFDGMQIQTFTDDCHLTPAGNEKIAASIFEVLARSRLNR